MLTPREAGLQVAPPSGFMMSANTARVPRGTRVRLGRVDGDLLAEPRVEVDGEGDAGIVVTGTADFEGDATIRSSMECGALRARDGRFRAEGALTVHGELRADDAKVEIVGPLSAGEIEVDRSLALHADATASGIHVGGSLEADATLSFLRLEVGGRLRVKGLAKGGRVGVGGVAELGQAQIEALEVGGKADVASGTVTGKVEVGGIFSAPGPFNFGELEVGGLATIGPGRGGDVEVGGRFRATGPLAIGRLEVGGIAEVEGPLTAQRIEVGGRLEVRGSLTVAEQMEVGGSARVSGDLDAGEMDIGGEITAHLARVRNTATVGGMITTEVGFKARRVELGKRGRAKGPLIGDTVELSKGADAGQVFGRIVRIGRDCEVDQVIGDEVEIGDGSQVGRVIYRTSLKADRSVRFREPAQHVDTLPTAPL